VATTPEVTQVDLLTGDEVRSRFPEGTTYTKALPQAEIARAISNVVARADRDYALDLVVVLQVRARMAEDTGERLTLDEFASLEGWEEDLAHLRSEWP
jgi:hypothetical protein